jgi:predicted metal-dependent hydrolase
MHALTTGQAQRDLTDRAGVEALLRRFYGPVAERANTEAARIAWELHRRLTGIDSKELDAIVRQ